MTFYPDRQAALEAEVARHWQGTTDGAHDLGHLRRVWCQCQTIAASEPGANLHVLQAAAFLHDLINLPKTSPDRARASTLSAKAAADFLETTDFPPDLIPDVAHAIAAHSYSAALPARTIEARILQDADRLDALGAIGLARMFCVAGATGARLLDPDDPLAQNRPLDDKRFSLDHLETKLFRLPDLMQTALGTTLARERVAIMRAFRDQILAETH